MRIFYPGSPDIPAGLAPNGKPWPTLRLEQLEAIYRLKRVVLDGIKVDGMPDRYHSALVGAGLGSGKTVTSVEVIMHTKPERCLIVGVRDAYDQWAEAIRDQQTCPDDEKRELFKIDSSPAGKLSLAKLLAGEPGLYYAGLEMLRAQDWEEVSETVKTDPELNRILGGLLPEEVTVKSRRQMKTYANMKPVDLLISDESHKHSNQKSASIKTVRTIKAKAKIALSGTFFGNKFENAWALTMWLWGAGVIDRKSLWETKFALKEPVMSKDGRTVMRTKYGSPIMKFVGEKIPGEFVETLPCYIFMPTPIGTTPEPEVVKIALHPEQQRQYNEMEAQSLTFLPTLVGGRAPLVADLPLTQRMRLRTAALGGMTLIPAPDDDTPDTITFQPGTPSSTLVALHEILHRPDWVGEKALILTHSKEFANEVARRMRQKYTVALKTGSTAKKWAEDKRRFRLPKEHPDSIQYVIGVISAIGTATDGLQDNCSRVVWLSEDDNNANNVQASNRIWRSGVDLSKYAAVKIVQRGTVAEGVLAKNNQHRDRTMDSVAGQQ